MNKGIKVGRMFSQSIWPSETNLRVRDSPEPSGMDLTNVGNIFTVAVGLKSRERPFFISFLKRVMISIRVSSESLMA